MDVQLEAEPFDLAFHPSSSLLAAGLITGRLQLFKVGGELEVQSLWNFNAHDESCRAVRFSEDGKYILTGSPDRSILATDVETGRALARLTNAHCSPVNRLINLSEWRIATGDDDGTIKVWDMRQNSCCSTFSIHDDYVSDLEFVPTTSQLLGVSGDGTLSVCNLRYNRVDARSEFSEDELLSVVLMKNGRKIVCGSQDGVLLLYSWNHFKDCSDRFVGHPKSVDSILKLDEDTILTGSSDGLIRVISILPNKMIGVIGEHADFPIERLAFSCDRKILGSASHDQTLKLWDTAYLMENNDKMDEDASIKEAKCAANLDSDTDDYNSDEGNVQKAKRQRKIQKGTPNSSSNFFSDLL